VSCAELFRTARETGCGSVFEDNRLDDRNGGDAEDQRFRKGTGREISSWCHLMASGVGSYSCIKSLEI